MNTQRENFWLLCSSLLLLTMAPWLRAEESEVRPCCFPKAFQAIVADMRSAASGDMRLFGVYRDWDKKMQVQKILIYAPPGQVAPVASIILDFNNSVQYMLTASGDCQGQPLDYGMLEPCIPDDATYLGGTYLGYGQDTTRFQTWSFRRSGHGRNISMVVSVTLEGCVPIMETISGTLGRAPIDSLVTFTTFQELQDTSVFDVPPNCFSVK